MKVKNRRVLFILHIPPPVHGSSVVGQNIKKSQIINSAFNCRYVNLTTSVRINEIGKNNFRKIFRYLKIIGTTLHELLVFKPHLCFMAITVTGKAFYKDCFLAVLFRIFNVNTVYHLHNKGISGVQNKFLYNLMYKFVFKKAKVVLLSHFLYPDIQKYVPENKVYYCPNGISENNTEVAFRANQELKVKSHNLEFPGKKKGIVEILFFSNLIESKGVFQLLQSCLILREKQLPFHCTFAGGEGDLNAKQFRERVCEMGLDDYVHYTGPRYGIEKEITFLNADIFVFPTYYHNECFPLVLLEAMKYSLPIISTYEGGVKSIVDEGETGFLVPQKNVEILAEKIEILINNPTLRVQMGKTGNEKFRKHFTLNAFENRLKEILIEVVEAQ